MNLCVDVIVRSVSVGGCRCENCLSDTSYSNSTQERGHSTQILIPRNLCGPHLHTQIHAYLATNINK
jgi:hypothetical protein